MDDERVDKSVSNTTRDTTSADFLRPKLASDISRAKDVIAHQSEHYSDWTLLRALVSAIPYIGGSLDLLIASRGQKLAQERILNLLSALSEEMHRIDQNTVKREFLETEEWHDLVIMAVEASARTRSKEKIRYYARILRGAATEESGEDFSPEEYLVVLAGLTPREIEVARAIYNQQRVDTRKGAEVESDLRWAKSVGWERLPSDCPSVPPEDLPFILSRLQSTGLIHEITGAYLGYIGGVYLITDAFRKLVDYLGSLDTD